MAKQLFTDNAKTTLLSSLAQGATTVVVVAAGGNKFPAPTSGDWAELTLYQKDVSGNEINVEIVKVTDRSADTFTVVRDIYNITGSSGGYAYPGTAGTVYVELRLTAGGVGNMTQRTMNLSDVDDVPTARANLGLGDSATKNTGTAAGTVAAGDHNHSGTYAPATTGSAILKGNGTGGFSSAAAGTDYAPGTSALATGIVKNTTTTGALSIATAGTDYQAPIGTISGLAKGNGANALTAATGSDVVAALGASTIPVANGGTGATTAANARTALGLGSAATLTAGTAANNVVQLDGTARLPAVDGSQLTNVTPAPPNGAFRTKQIFTVSGTWTKPAGCVRVKVTCTGGGGSGSGVTADMDTCGGGGAGGTVIAYFEASSLAATVAVTVGYGGPNSMTSPGNDGGTSSFGAYCSASGGSAGGTGGGTNTRRTGGVGGVGSGGVINMRGGPGSAGVNATGSKIPGLGGNSYFGGGASHGYNDPGTGQSGQHGGGGSGALRTGSSGNTAGGAGGDGIVIVEEFY